MRFFQNTPMAIATVDKTGRGVARSNARFASTFEDILKQGDERSILSVVAERDRPALEAAIRKAGEGQGDIAPVGSRACRRQRALGHFLRIGDGIDVVHIEPLANDTDTDVRLVLMVGDQQLDAFADDLATEFIDRHARGEDRARTKVV